MARFNTRPLEQSGDGGAKENKKWSGSIPGHWNVVEMEGIEPSSKQGSHTLSTCLFQPSVFVQQQDLDHQLLPYPLRISSEPRGQLELFPIFLHRGSERFGTDSFQGDVSSLRLAKG